MDKIDNSFITKLDDSNSLIDVLIQLENFLDNLDIYVFKNWFDGEVIDGPIIKKYWVGMALMYQYNKMPDPEGALVLEKHGAKVKFSLRNIEDSNVTKDALDLPSISQLTDFEGGMRVYGNNSVASTRTHVPNVKKVWIIEIMIPRIFIDELNALDIDIYDQSSEDDFDNYQNNSSDVDSGGEEDDS